MSSKDGKRKRPLVPRLRFPEFRESGEWQSPSLGDISEPVEERVGDQQLTPISISAGIGFVPQYQKFGRDISGNQYRLYTVVRDGDFVYNKGNSIRYPQGCVYDLQGWGKVAAPNVFICFRMKDGFENSFFRQCFEKNAHGIQLRKHITSGARSNGLLNISKEDFYAIRIPIPEHAEQQKIADCLSSLDELISLEAQKLEALKRHKKGLMQQLFPREGETIPRLRFPEFREALSVLPLVNVANFVSDKISINQITVGNYVSTENLLPDFGGLNPSEKLPSVSFVTSFYPNDILVSNIRPYLKKVVQAKIAGGASNDVIVLRAKKNMNPDYLSSILRSDFFIDYVMRGAKGVKMPRGEVSMIKQFPVPCFSFAEQQKIADCLSSLDERITLEAQKLEALKRHKKGLMQQLFPVLDDGV